MKLPSAPSSTLPATSIEVRPASVADGRVPALKLWGIRRSIGLAIVAALLIVVLLIAGALWYAGFPGVRRDDTVTAGTLFDLLKLVFAVVAGIGGVAALVVAYRRQRVAEHTNKLAEFAHGLARLADKRAEVSKALAEAAEERAALESDRNGVRLFNERFVKASEQLGSEKAAVRLAGVYSMAGLADDWQQGRQTCIDVLCAYLRMPYTPPDASAGEPHSGRDDEDFEQNALAARQEREVRRTVMRVIGEHLSLDEEDPTSWCGRDFDFTGAVFDGGSFNAARFSGGKVSFKEATFGGGSLFFAGVTFSGGEVSFDGATFSGGEVLFVRATFNGASVYFAEADFSGAAVSFQGATFSGGMVSFAAADFSGGKVSFKEATFSGGDVFFVKAAFSGALVSFGGANFAVPPRFDAWPDGNPPAGLILP